MTNHEGLEAQSIPGGEGQGSLRAEERPFVPSRDVSDSGDDRPVWSVGSWLSAALDDPKVCDEMKADIREWFDGGGYLKPALSAPGSEAVK